MIVPPWAATSVAAMDSPSPVPPLARLRGDAGQVHPLEVQRAVHIEVREQQQVVH